MILRLQGVQVEIFTLFHVGRIDIEKEPLAQIFRLIQELSRVQLRNDDSIPVFAQHPDTAGQIRPIEAGINLPFSGLLKAPNRTRPEDSASIAAIQEEGGVAQR